MTKSWLFDITTYLPHPKLSHKENWSFGDLVLANCLQQRFAIASQYFLVLVQNTTLNGDKNQKKPIVTPGGAECGLQLRDRSPYDANIFVLTTSSHIFLKNWR
jgi:hypothetical protein